MESGEALSCSYFRMGRVDEQDLVFDDSKHIFPLLLELEVAFDLLLMAC